MNKLTVLQLVPKLDTGGVERGTFEIASALTNKNHRAIVVSGGGKFVPLLTEQKAIHICLPIGEKKLSSLALIKKLRQIIVKNQVDIVHARSRLPAWLGWWAIKGLPVLKRPLWVTTVHGPYSVNSYSKIMTSGDSVIVISDFIKEYVLKNYPRVDPQSIKIIPRGVDTLAFNQMFEPSKEWQQAWREEHPRLTSDTCLLSLPGRLTRWKGQLEFIEMIRVLETKGIKAHGLIIGGAHQRHRTYEQELKKAARDANIEHKITFLGDRDDMREILSISTISFSLTQEPEAFGRTTIEALSLGTPVIGYQHGGTGEILSELFPEGIIKTGDLTAAVEKTCSFLRDTLPGVKTNNIYTTSAMQNATLETYSSLVATKSSHPDS